MKTLENRIYNLTANQRALLSRRLQSRRGALSAGGANQRLAAYIVCTEEDEATIDRLRDYLREKLPAYMLPAVYVTLDALPLTPNGKVDRRALPDPETVAGPAAAYVAPRTTVETALATIWGEALGVEMIGVHDNFFELGGHSLLVTQTIFRVGDVFEVELPLRSLFEAPTIAEFAPLLEEALLENLEASLPEAIG